MDKRSQPSPFRRIPGSEFVVERPQLAGVSRSMDSLLKQIGLQRASLGGRDEVEDPLYDSWVVFACVQVLTEAVRQVPLKVWESDAADAQEVPEDHPIRQLFDMPNSDMGLSDLLAAGISHRKLSGEDWWFLMDAEGKPIVPSIDARAPIPMPTVIVPVSGSYVDDERDPSTGRIQRVQYGASSTSAPPVFPVGSTVHFYDYNPADPQRGLSPLDAAMRVISVGFQTERYQEAVMRGGGPGAFLKYEEGMSNDEEFRLQESANEAMRDPDVVGGFKVLTGKVDVLPNPATPKDMLQRETLGWVRDTVCSILQVPPPVIGNYDTATYNNVTEAYRQFWQSVKGYLDSVAEKINSHFLGRLQDPRLAGCMISFDYSGIASLQEDQSSKWKLAAELAAYGVGLSFNDATKILGLEAETVDSASTVFVPASNQVFAVNDPNTGDSEPVAPDAGAPAAEPMPAAPAAPATPAAPAAPEGLNGAQVESLLLIAERVGSGQLTIDAGAALINAAFPSISLDQARVILGGVSAPAAPAAAEMRSKMLDTREERVAFVEAIYAKTLDQSERKMASEVLTWLRRYERAQKERLRDVAENGIASTSKAWTQREVESYLLLNKEQWAEQLDALISQTVTATWQAGLTETAQLLGMVSVDVTEPRILRLIADQRAQIVEGVTSRLADEIRDRLLVKLSGPTSTPELAGELTEILPELDEELGRVFGNKEARALTIARTETGKAYNSASFDRYQESGATGLQWVASNDAATRESHRELDGKIVKPGEEFKPGLRFPNDPNGAPEEVINCRCVIAPII